MEEEIYRKLLLKLKEAQGCAIRQGDDYVADGYGGFMTTKNYFSVKVRGLEVRVNSVDGNCWLSICDRKGNTLDTSKYDNEELGRLISELARRYRCRDFEQESIADEKEEKRIKRELKRLEDI